MRLAAPNTALPPAIPVRRVPLPPGTWPAVIAIFVAGGIGPNAMLVAIALVILVLGLALLWRPGESPVLLFTFAYSWLQASISALQANWLGVNVSEMTKLPGDLHAAILLSLFGLLAMAVGMRLGAGAWRWQDAVLTRMQASAMPFNPLVKLYLATTVATLVILIAAAMIPGLAQFFLALASLKWAVFFIVAYTAFGGSARDKQIFLLIFLFELGWAIGAFFSDFKTVFFFTMFAAVASGARPTPRAIFGLAVLSMFTLAFAVVWSAVKIEYRQFVSGGSNEQVVTVDYPTRIAKLGELIGDLDAEKLADGVDKLIGRLSYVEYFSATRDYVPHIVPHEEGAILWDAVTRPFMPRLFFPDKAIIDDTSRTNQYTGGLAGDYVGTSISLGYIAEAYIDFGDLGIFPTLLLIGFLYGRIYTGFLRWSMTQGLLGMALATAILAGVGTMDNSFTKVFGGVMVATLAAWLLAKFVIPRVMSRLAPRRLS